MLSEEQIEKRRRIMQRSIALGHCVCDPTKPCPCPKFKEINVCECAGERVLPKDDGSIVKLTEYVRSAGCASKVGKKILHEVLQGLPEIHDPRVLVGSAAGDDAGVILLDEKNATILTIDVFTPSVDDPYTFGQIAAANSISDIYAMGGTPQSCLSFIGFPVYQLPLHVMHEILRGGIDKMAEAGISVIGGHSLNDEEPKCGFAVIGSSPAEKFIRNSGASINDVLVITKPLGNGIIAFANQVGRAQEQWMKNAAFYMTQLNKIAAENIQSAEVHAMTDITGFSFLGHLSEIVKNSKVQIDIDFDSIPVMDGAKEMACQNVVPGAVERNRESVSPELLDFDQLTTAQQFILFSPETSGGLLLFISADSATQYVENLQKAGITAKIIGKVTNNQNSKIKIHSSQQKSWETVPLASQPINNNPKSIKNNINALQSPPLACCANPPQIAETPSQNTSSDKPNPSQNALFTKYLGASLSSDGAIDLKHKKLTAIALSVATKCGPCIHSNIETAKEFGATDAQIAEAVEMGIAFGGASALMFYKTC